MTSPITLHQPTASELQKLADIGRETFVETFGHLYSAVDLDAFLQAVFSLDAVRHDFETERMSYAVAVVPHSGEWIAYCKVGPCTVPNVAPNRRYEELRQLYVRRPWQGTGVAAKLMEWAMAELESRNLDDIYLSVWSENIRAQRFYKRYGFTPWGEYKFMVGNHADHELIFRKALRSSP